MTNVQKVCLFIIIVLSLLLAFVIFYIITSKKDEKKDSLEEKLLPIKQRLREIRVYQTEVLAILEEYNITDNEYRFMLTCKDVNEYNLAIKNPKRMLTQIQFEAVKNYDFYKISAEAAELRDKYNKIMKDVK